MPLGFAFQGVASKRCVRDKSQLKWRFWWIGSSGDRVRSRGVMEVTFSVGAVLCAREMCGRGNFRGRRRES